MQATAIEPMPYDVERYFALADCGMLAPDDRVELLEGLIVAMPPLPPMHAAIVGQVEGFLRERLGAEVWVRVQMPFVASSKSVPEPDVAVVRGGPRDFMRRHPSQALLVVEVSESLAQDRLTKATIYAAAGVPDYWIVNLRDSVVETYCKPEPARRLYRQIARVEGSERLTLSAFPELDVQAAELVLDD